jgi:hypothetical protein
MAYYRHLSESTRQFAGHRKRGNDYNDPQEVVAVHGLRNKGGEGTLS